MWKCEHCGIGWLDIKEIYQCWRVHLTTRVIEDLGLRDGAIVCENCYKFFEDKKLDLYRDMDFPDFLTSKEMKL